MKKLVTLVVILVLVIAGWAGATYYTGYQAEKTHSQLLAKYAKLGPLSFKVEDYQRGFARSTARVVMEMKVPKVEPGKKGEAPKQSVETVRLVFGETIEHGPLPGGAGLGLATIETRLVDVSPGHDEFVKLQTEVPALKGVLDVTRIDFDGTLHSATRIPKIHVEEKDGTFDWKGWNSNVTWSPRKKFLVGDFDLAGLQVAMKDGSIKWDGVKGQMDLTEALPLLYVGKTHATMGTLDMDFLNKTNGQREQFTMKGMELNSTSAYEGAVVNMSQEMKFAGLDVEGQTYGPGELDIEMRNFDGRVMSDFQKQVYDLYGSAETMNPDELAGQLLPLYGQLGAKLLEKSPEFNIRRFQLLTPKGNIEGSLLVKYDGSQGVHSNAPQAMIQAVDAKADLALNENLVKLLVADKLVTSLKAARSQGQLPATYTDEKIEDLAQQQAGAQIESVLAQKLAVRDGEMIRSNATFKGGELVVNGQNLPLFQ